MRIAVALTASVTLLVAGCGGSSAPSSTGAAAANGPLSYARCMRSNGVPSFPDPDAQGHFPSFDAGASKQVSSAADSRCRHFISSGGTATPQQRQQKIEFGVKVAECLRKHGYPDFPDPVAGGSLHLPPDVDTRSPQFQAAETACEKTERKALGLP